MGAILDEAVWRSMVIAIRSMPVMLYSAGRMQLAELERQKPHTQTWFLGGSIDTVAQLIAIFQLGRVDAFRIRCFRPSACRHFRVRGSVVGGHVVSSQGSVDSSQQSGASGSWIRTSRRD